MLDRIAHHEVFGLEVIILLGITTLSLVVITAILGLRSKGANYKKRRKWHLGFALVTIAFGLTHGILILLTRD
jgi:hypothetical protein